MILKYIIVRNEDLSFGNQIGPEHAILFDMDLIHWDIARVHRLGRLMLVSAGFVEINGSDIRAFGKSDSIGISSRPDVDTKIIQSLFTPQPVQ